MSTGSNKAEKILLSENENPFKAADPRHLVFFLMADDLLPKADGTPEKIIGCKS